MISPKHRFFCTDPESGFLDEDESAHANRVLRLVSGDRIEIINGKGARIIARITESSKNRVGFQIEKQELTEQDKPEIHIAIAPTKNIDRFEFFLEKVTEIGISEISPVLCRNSERKEIKKEKLEKNLVASIKQSGNVFLPKLNNLTSFMQFIESHKTNDCQKFIAHCAEDAHKIQLADSLNPAKNVVILIGPEGDFSQEEITKANQSGFRSVALGNSRLRTETAGIAACLTVHLKI